MRSFFQKKLWIVLLAILGLGALTVLATSLDHVPFNEAERFGSKEPMQLPPISLRPVTEVLADIPLWKQLVVWGLVTLMVVLIGMLFSPEMRRRLLNMFLRASLIVLATFERSAPQLLTLLVDEGVPRDKIFPLRQEPAAQRTAADAAAPAVDGQPVTR